MMKTAARLAITPLEDRTVPAGFGNAWVDTNLTVSFVPDGTDVDGAPSSLFRTLGARATTAEWQAAIKTAFQTWAVPTNLNFSFVSDDGRPLGTPGPVQGSPFVGDIRVSARPLSDNVLAIANPFDLISPWAGEVVLNSNKVFDTDGSADANDLYSVLLHEAGHALGLEHSADPASVMQSCYNRVTALAPADVAAVQALYGVRTGAGTGGAVIVGQEGTAATAGDWATGKGANETTATATDLGQSRDSTDRRWDFAGRGSFDAAADRDVYLMRTREKAGGVLVVYVGTLPGQAKPTVTVYDKKGAAVAATTLQAQDGSLIVQVTNIKKNQTYYVSVQVADPTKWTGAEDYRIGIDFRDTAVVLDSFATGTLTQDQNQITRTLQVTNSTLFRLQLAVNSATDTAPTAARLTVFDAAGTAVFTLVARSGQTVLGDVLLPPGAYTVVIAGATRDGSPLKGLAIDARFLALTDPIGPGLTDDYGTTGAALVAPAAPPPTAPSGAGFFWLAPPTVGSGFLDPTSFYSSPWW